MAFNDIVDEVNVWKNRIVRAYKSRRDIEKRWDLTYNRYNGRYFDQFEAKDRYCVSWDLAIVRQMASSLAFQDPEMNFRPLTLAGEQAAPIGEQIVKLERRIMDAQTEEKDALITCLLYGTAIIKSGYNAEYSVQDPVAKGKVKRDQYSTGSSIEDGYTDDAVIPQPYETEHDQRINKGHAWQKNVMPWDFLIDPECTCYEDARWAAHRFVRPWVAVQRDSRYDPQVRKDIGPSGRATTFDNNALWSQQLDWRDSAEAVDSSLVSLYEIEDKVNKRILVISDQCDKPLMVMPTPFIMREGIYTILRFLKDDRSFWGIPYTDTFAIQVETLNKLRSQAMDHLQKWGCTRAAYREGSGVTQEQMESWVRDGIDSVVCLESGEPIDDLVKIFPQIAIAGDVWRLMEIYQDDLNKVSGVDELAMGGSSNRTATADSIQSQQSGLRTSDMRWRYEEFLRTLCRKTFAIVRQFWDNNRVVPLVGPDGQLWNEVRVPRETLFAEFDVDIEANSTERVDSAVRKRQIIEAMQTLQPFVPFLNAQGWDLNWPYMIRNYLKLTEFSRNPDRALIQLPPPQPQPAQGQNVVPFPGQQGGQPPESMMQSPQQVNGMGQMQQQGMPFQMQRMNSEANGGS